MKELAFTLVLALFASCAHSQHKSFFDEVDTFFETYVSDGLVDYAALNKESGSLEKIVSLIATTPQMEGDVEKAFLINAYNILAIKVVIDSYPIEGPLQVDGFFDSEVFEVHTKPASLNSLEKGFLYQAFPDPLLHLVLVCAAKGCPKLASHAYRPDILYKQLEETTGIIINDSNFTRIDKETGQLQLSQIFEWYEDDFGGKEGVMDFIKKYYNGKIKDPENYGHYEYDWSINKAE